MWAAELNAASGARLSNDADPGARPAGGGYPGPPICGHPPPDGLPMPYELGPPYAGLPANALDP